MHSKENYPIDFVITWVDTNDEEWLAKKNQYLQNEKKDIDVRTRRFRDWDNLKYWFRAVEKYAPWVNHIYLVTPGQCPNWLDTSNEKIVLINQDSLFDDKYLPTFNNCAVELLLHKIPGLSEHFVYFNDDMFLMNEVKPEDFFKNGLPLDTVGFAANPIKVDINGKGICNIVHSNTMLVSKHFDSNEVYKANKRKLFDLKNGRDIFKTLTALPYVSFVGFNEPHTANSYIKATFEDMWNRASADLERGISARFREDYALSQWGVRYWQICMGNFEVRKKNFFKLFCVTSETDAILASTYIKRGKSKIVCVNDDIEDDKNVDEIIAVINKTLQEIHPDKSRFEK